MENVSITSALDFKTENLANELRKLDKINGNEVKIDVTKMGRIRALPLMIYLSKVISMNKKGKRFIVGTPLHDTNPIGYARNIGFFNALMNSKDDTLNFKMSKIKENFIPIMRVTYKTLYDSCKNGLDYHLGLEECSRKMAEIITNNGNLGIQEYVKSDLNSMLSYCIREMIRNTFEHNTDGTSLWVMAQKHKEERTIELVFLDDGQGIKQNLSVNKQLAAKIRNDFVALKYALKSGISGNARKSNNKDKWGNSGYGLYMTSELVRSLGAFCIYSKGAGGYILGGNKLQQSKIQTNIDGTLIGLVIKIDKLNEKSSGFYNSYFDYVLRKGEERAQNDEFAIKSASMASKLKY